MTGEGDQAMTNYKEPGDLCIGPTKSLWERLMA